jgi:hypothetical protein
MINANSVCNCLTGRPVPTNQANLTEPEPEIEYWLLRNGEPVLRTFDRTAVANWIRENGTKGLKVLLPAR